DADALPTLIADEYENVDHTTGVPNDRQGELSTLRALLSAHDPTCLNKPLATLGDSLALFRLWVSAAGIASQTFDCAPFELERIVLGEADARGRSRRVERSAADRLGDAVARLYERYAELLPDGPARVRAAATARSVAALVGPLDPDRLATALAPAVEFVDHRPIGFPSTRGAEALMRHIHSLFEAADDIVTHVDDILGLQPDALLVRWTTSGTDRTGGGAFERQLFILWVFGADGLVTHFEEFDADRGDEALARFDELTGAPAAAHVAGEESRAAKRL